MTTQSEQSPRPAGRRAALGWSLLGLVPLIASALPLAWHYLVNTPAEVWQVDLQVYREGARALASGFPIYELRTDQPQFLPFTYPPFAAVTALPLLLASFHVIGWVWTALQLALLWYSVGVAFRPFLARFGVRAGLVQGVLAAGGAWLMPVSEGVRYGQVNAVIVALCLWDVTRRRRFPDGTRRWDGGNGIGVAIGAALKLTPAVFWLHWAASRRWHTLKVSIATAAVITVGTALLLPPASATYWTDALLDPSRLGPNAGTSNQSLRGFLLRALPGGGAIGTLIWFAAVALVVGGRLALARRFDAAGEPVAVVATIGLLAFLISPVSWVHHLHWGVVVLGTLLGTGRDRRRVAVTLIAAALLWMRLPWWGADLLGNPPLPRFLAQVLQNSFTEWALLALLALWWVARRPPPAAAPDSAPAGDAAADTAPADTAAAGHMAAETSAAEGAATPEPVPPVPAGPRSP